MEKSLFSCEQCWKPRLHSILIPKQKIYTIYCNGWLWKMCHKECKSWKSVEKGCKMSSCEQDKVTAITNPKQVWMPIVSLHKNGTVNSQAQMEEGLRGFYPSWLEFATDRFKESEDNCLQLSTHWWSHQAPTNSSNPMVIQAALIKLNVTKPA